MRTKRGLKPQPRRLNRMFFGNHGSPTSKDDEAKSIDATNCIKNGEDSYVDKNNSIGNHTFSVEEKKGVGSKASSLIASAKNSLHLTQTPNSSELMQNVADQDSQTPLQKLGKHDAALSVPQGQYNNSAGDSHPGPRSTFTVGVWEDRNKKCRRTMEDTHAFLYNFLRTPAPALELETPSINPKIDEDNTLDKKNEPASPSNEMMETDNGYFAIFDGHAGTFAADWCGKKLHIILEEMIRTNPNIPIPELLDQTFTNVDAQLEKLPLRNSGCTAVTAILRWEDRLPNCQSPTGSTSITPTSLAALQAANNTNITNDIALDNSAATVTSPSNQTNGALTKEELINSLIQNNTIRQRVLYTANVGDARIILCRKGRALRLSYDHKGSDENEGKRVASAGGLILNNRVNGVLAVTRALGDNYMKDLVTGHPYTTETVIQPDMDEFIILACDGVGFSPLILKTLEILLLRCTQLWDVCSDQEAVNLIREIEDPTAAAKKLVDYALARFTTDNLSCMIVRFNRPAILTATTEPNSAIGVEGDPYYSVGKISEAEKIVEDARRKIIEDGVPGIGISGSNFGKGYDSNINETAGEEDDKEETTNGDPEAIEDVG